jgi:hypothetical protein
MGERIIFQIKNPVFSKIPTFAQYLSKEKI